MAVYFAHVFQFFFLILRFNRKFKILLRKMFSAYLLFPKISGTWWNTKVEDIDVLSMFINSFLTFRDLTENFKFC